MLQQQHDWIPLDFRPLFIPHRVSRIPHLRVRQPLRAVICSGYCSVISRFRFSLPFFPFFFSPPSLSLFISLLNAVHHNRIELELPNGNTLGNRYTYLIKDHCRVESLRSEDGSMVPSSEFGISLVNDRPYFSNLPYTFFFPQESYFSSAFTLQPIFLPSF